MAMKSVSYLFRTPVRMSMRELDQLRTTSDGLWGSVGLNQKLEVMEFIGSQLKNTLRMLIMHGLPLVLEDGHNFYSHSLF